MNYWYLNIYVLWMNTILNIVLPIISLVVLNILVSTRGRAGMGDVNIPLQQPIQSPVHRLVLSTVQPQAQSGSIQLKLVLVRVLVLKLVLVQVSRRIEAHLKSLDANDAASASFKANQRLTRQVKVTPVKVLPNKQSAKQVL